MSSTIIKKRPLAGSATALVWEIADELFRKTGAIPTSRQVIDIYVAKGRQESTGRTQFSYWKKAHLNHFKRGAVYGAMAQANPTSTGSMQLNLGTDGRVVIPAEMRAAMRIGSDSRVTARVVDGELRVIALKVAIRRAQEMIRNAVPDGVSLADELIAERRAEAQQDAAT